MGPRQVELRPVRQQQSLGRNLTAFFKDSILLMLQGVSVEKSGDFLTGSETIPRSLSRSYS
jgi:hypothetical protein